MIVLLPNAKLTVRSLLNTPLILTDAVESVGVAVTRTHEILSITDPEYVETPDWKLGENVTPTMVSSCKVDTVAILNNQSNFNESVSNIISTNKNIQTYSFYKNNIHATLFTVTVYVVDICRF